MSAIVPHSHARRSLRWAGRSLPDRTARMSAPPRTASRPTLWPITVAASTTATNGSSRVRTEACAAVIRRRPHPNSSPPQRPWTSEPTATTQSASRDTCAYSARGTSAKSSGVATTVKEHQLAARECLHEPLGHEDVRRIEDGASTAERRADEIVGPETDPHGWRARTRPANATATAQRCAPAPSRAAPAEPTAR